MFDFGRMVVNELIRCDVLQRRDE